MPGVVGKAVLGHGMYQTAGKALTRKVLTAPELRTILLSAAKESRIGPSFRTKASRRREGRNLIYRCFASINVEFERVPPQNGASGIVFLFFFLRCEASSSRLSISKLLICLLP